MIKKEDSWINVPTDRVKIVDTTGAGDLFATGYFGYLYLIGAAILGGIFIQKSWKLKQSSGADNSMSLFLYSIVYLTLIFLLMIVDRAVITYV